MDSDGVDRYMRFEKKSAVQTNSCRVDYNVNSYEFVSSLFLDIGELSYIESEIFKFVSTLVTV